MDAASTPRSPVTTASSGAANMSETIDNFESIIRLLNASQNAYPDLLDSFARNRDLNDPAFFTFLALYAALICLGAAGNGMVVWAVARKRSMRTARNMFIVNLAVSDLLLCLVTMPLTLMEIATKYWPLGREEFICKMLGTLQAVSIFVSTISITAIALDRYQVIVYPTGNNIQKVGAIVISVMIWVVSLLLASPLFVFRTLDVHLVEDVGTVAYCIEKWPVTDGRAYYSIFSLLFQYVFPIVIVTLAYSRICKKLRYRYVNSSASKRNAGLPVPTGAPSQRPSNASANPQAPQGAVVAGCAFSAPPAAVKEVRPKQAKDDRRIKRTNALFISIALIFGVSWLPLNVFNLAMDTWSGDLFGHNRQAMLITYAACHMVGMSSACTNPMLYGWLNENFRKEFREILDVVACRLLCCLSRPDMAVGAVSEAGGGVAGGGASSALPSSGGRSSGRRSQRSRHGSSLLGGRLLKVPGRGRKADERLARELTNGNNPDMTTSLVHADETTSFTHVL